MPQMGLNVFNCDRDHIDGHRYKTLVALIGLDLLLSNWLCLPGDNGTRRQQLAKAPPVAVRRSGVQGTQVVFFF